MFLYKSILKSEFMWYFDFCTLENPQSRKRFAYSLVLTETLAFLRKSTRSRPRSKGASGPEFSYDCGPLRFLKRSGTEADVTALDPRAEGEQPAHP